MIGGPSGPSWRAPVVTLPKMFKILYYMLCAASLGFVFAYVARDLRWFL